MCFPLCALPLGICLPVFSCDVQHKVWTCACACLSAAQDPLDCAEAFGNVSMRSFVGQWPVSGTLAVSAAVPICEGPSSGDLRGDLSLAAFQFTIILSQAETCLAAHDIADNGMIKLRSASICIWVSLKSLNEALDKARESVMAGLNLPCSYQVLPVRVFGMGSARWLVMMHSRSDSCHDPALCSTMHFQWKMPEAITQSYAGSSQLSCCCCRREGAQNPGADVSGAEEVQIPRGQRGAVC